MIRFTAFLSGLFFLCSASLVLPGLVFSNTAFIGSASAQAQCLDETISATGTPSGIGELARANAFFTWKSVVKAKKGAEYNSWSAATERKLVCVDLMEGENKGKWECTRSARPCLQVAVKAKAQQCQEKITTAYGARHVSQVRAKAEAAAGWAHLVKKTYGDEWAGWEAAKSANIKCSRKTKNQYQCVASGMACKN